MGFHDSLLLLKLIDLITSDRFIHYTKPPMKLGYACINMTLSKDNVTTNRSMINKTFLQRGLPYCSELALMKYKIECIDS